MVRLKIVAAAAVLAVAPLSGCQREPSQDQSQVQASLQPASAPMPGNAAPSFTLTDSEGAPRSLSQFRGRTVVLEWTNEGCPYVQKHYTGAMQALQREAVEDGVVWLTIISSAPGTQGYVEGEQAQSWRARTGAASTHLLLDPTGEVGKLYGAKTTPDMRIIGPDGRLTFVGGIDDRPTNKPEDLEGANNHVRTALTDMTAGRAVQTAYAPPYGCSIKYPETVES